MSTGLIFDLDGTLVDTAADLAAAMNYALSQMGLVAVDPLAVRSLVGFGARRMLVRGIELANGDPSDERIIDRGLNDFLAHYEANIAVNSKPFDGAISMIEDFKTKGMVFAICTNKREALARQLLEKLAISDLFGAIVGADTAAAPKPDSAPVLLAVEKIAAKKSIFIGDSDTDIKAAQNANLPCLVASFGYGPITMEAAADACFGSYRECAAIIEAREFR